MFYKSKMLKIVTFLILSDCILKIRSSDDHKIGKRALIFPRGTVFQISSGLSVPVVLPSRTVILTLCAQANYNLPSNLTTLNFKTISARHNSIYFDLSRENLYKHLINIFSSFGLDGEQCLLRAICEIAEFPMDMENDYLLEKIAHFIFTPSLDIAENWSGISTNETNNFMDQTLEAEKFGNGNGSCEFKYSGCILSIVDLFSAKYLIK